MRVPKMEQSDRYVGLYVIDFGEQTGVGFTAPEVAELLESEKYTDCKVYKVHNAHPDGRLELRGVPAQTFSLEAGMFFYSADLETAQKEFKQLVNLAEAIAPPCRAKVHLAGCSPDRFVVAIIYPAEYDDEVSRLLLDGRYKTSGAAEGGTAAVQRYYDAKPELLDRHQLFGQTAVQSRTGEELLTRAKLAVQR
jgi:hypothetical protein